MVQIHPDPPLSGAIAQLGEHLLCKQGVVGSIPTGSTIPCVWERLECGFIGQHLFCRVLASEPQVGEETDL